MLAFLFMDCCIVVNFFLNFSLRSSILVTVSWWGVTRSYSQRVVDQQGGGVGQWVLMGVDVGGHDPQSNIF